VRARERTVFINFALSLVKGKARAEGLSAEERKALFGKTLKEQAPAFGVKESEFEQALKDYAAWVKRIKRKKS